MLIKRGHQQLCDALFGAESKGLGGNSSDMSNITLAEENIIVAQEPEKLIISNSGLMFLNASTDCYQLGTCEDRKYPKQNIELSKPITWVKISGTFAGILLLGFIIALAIKLNMERQRIKHFRGSGDISIITRDDPESLPLRERYRESMENQPVPQYTRTAGENSNDLGYYDSNGMFHFKQGRQNRSDDSIPGILRRNIAIPNYGPLNDNEVEVYLHAPPPTYQPTYQLSSV